ncbi:MAG TPA: TauD/TfdA family dioxygenase, partial [Phenylobacterium sp.]|nr:TauD/TfdA family dioxygenase [Phenylobacterium sp.]
PEEGLCRGRDGRHRWAPHTLLIWDNRRTIHLAEGGYDGHLRVMHRTTVAGEAPV